MPILAFQKPEKVIMLEETNSFGRFEFRPLEPGYGQTVGNALRRILLSSLGGFAICSIRIDGVAHELDTIPGVKEDVTNIILNLKQVRFKQTVEDTDTEKAVVNVSGVDVFKAGDLGKVLSGFEVLNPDLVICHLDSSANFQLEFTINSGRGWVPADENRELLEGADPSVIAIDSIYTPISPKDALKEASKILIQHFMMFSDEKMTLEQPAEQDEDEFDEEVLHMRQLLKSKLTDMSLSVRALNCLKSAEVETLGELVVFNKNDLLKFRNFGRKSLTELDNLLESLNLSFGMDISKYKLDKE